MSTPRLAWNQHQARKSKPRGQHLGSTWSEKWKSERIENGEKMEKLRDRKDFIFSPFCLVESGKVKGWKK